MPWWFDEDEYEDEDEDEDEDADEIMINFMTALLVTFGKSESKFRLRPSQWLSFHKSKLLDPNLPIKTTEFAKYPLRRKLNKCTDFL